MLPLYLDHNATTPVDESVLEQMLPWFRADFGNPSSAGHAYGWKADEAVERARAQLAALLGTAERSVTFTSGATEALNLAIKGTAMARRARGQHLVTVSSEHRAVLDPHVALQRNGFDVTYLGVDEQGLVDPDAVANALRDDTILLSVMSANNETGVIQDVGRLYELAQERGIVFLSDSTQAVGKIEVAARSADLLTCSAHKLYGPKGVGALIRNPDGQRLRLAPLIDGGGHESGLRAGTLNVPGIVGLGAAAARAADRISDDRQRLSNLRDRFEHDLYAANSCVRVNGAGAERLPQTSSVTFEGIASSRLIPHIRELAVSTGSACASGSGKPSHVLKAMGLSDADAMSTIRFSFGRMTTENDVDFAVNVLTEALKSM